VFVPPSTLHKELLKESSGHDPIVSHENPSRDKRRPTNRRKDNTQSATKKGRRVPDDGSPANSPQIGHDSNHRRLSDRISELSLQESGVQILRSVRHKVESSHQQDEITQPECMMLQRRNSLFHESLGRTVIGAFPLSLRDDQFKGVRFRQR